MSHPNLVPLWAAADQIVDSYAAGRRYAVALSEAADNVAAKEDQR